MPLSPSTVHLLGIPSEWGQARAGPALGAAALRGARFRGLWLGDALRGLGHTLRDAGDSPVLARPADHVRQRTDGRVYDMPQVAQALQAAYERAVPLFADDGRVIFLGGDHSVSIASIAAALTAGEVGVIWLDAHGDMNTPDTSPSGNLHGMPLAVTIGDGPPELTAIGGADRRVRPENVVLMGVRDLDPPEGGRLREKAITTLTMRDIDRLGVEALSRQILDQFEGLNRLHISLDLDFLDPTFAPGVGTRVPDGLSYREAHLLMELLGESGKIYSLDLVEVNPLLDIENRTAEVAVSLAATLFGARLF